MGEQIEPDQARILNLLPQSNGTAHMHIDSWVRGIDVLATIAYSEPNEKTRRNREHSLLKQLIESKGVLNNTSIFVPDPVGIIDDQITLQRTIQLGDRPTFSGLVKALRTVYDDEQTHEQLNDILCGVIDNGDASGLVIALTHNNEFIASDDAQLAREMQELTDEFNSDPGEL